MNYTKDFIDAVTFCRDNHLFLGFGNPNGRVLLIGKEAAFNHKTEPGSLGFIEEVLLESHSQNEINVAGWETNIRENTLPNWGDMPIELGNPLYSWGSQFNIANRRRGDEWNGGTSHTYLKYQKLYQFLNESSEKSEKINFQKDFFLTELNDIPTKYAFEDKQLDKLRSESVQKRTALLEKVFFQAFPVTIIAAGHYPRRYGFDMERTFNVKYNGEPTTVGKYWYNVHKSDDGKRILIHTRQLSTDVSDDLLKAIANECRSFFNLNN